ncbi:MAG TPA: zinc-ribbon domain-containing protein [Acidimicrobiales bacterium]|nr:zinc-ribbon domain-containing protein [Acidimicrobiales bacterium]
MFLIFGIKRMARRLATLFALCGHCGSPAAQVVVRRSTWFSLFFVPVIPLGTKYFTTCTLCGVTTRLDKDRAMKMVASAEQLSARSAAAPVTGTGTGTELQTDAPPPPAPPLQP